MEDIARYMYNTVGKELQSIEVLKIQEDICEKELRSIKVLEIREFEVGKYSEAREIRKERQIINKSSDQICFVYEVQGYIICFLNEYTK